MMKSFVKTSLLFLLVASAAGWSAQAGTTFTVLKSTDGAEAWVPMGNLALNGGYLYGATSGGGAAGFGGIYRIGPAGSDYAVVHEFTSSTDGYDVGQPLIEGNDGYLYGVATTSSNNLGSVFRLAKDGSSFAVVHRFKTDKSDGEFPDSALVETSPGVFVSCARIRVKPSMQRATVKVRSIDRDALVSNIAVLRAVRD